MARRQLGATGIEVSEIGVGTWELSGDVWGEKDDATSLAAIRAGLDAGANLIDTAADYGQGHVEELLGRLLAEDGVDRDDLVISTKVRPECMVFAPPPERSIGEFFRPEWIRAECEGSLRRLGTDYVDVLFLHTWSRSWGHEHAWFDAMAKLKDDGKIRAIGISVPDLGAGDANVAIVLGQVDVVQCVYSVFQQEPEYTLFPLAQAFDVGVMARSPFSSGAVVQHWTPEMRFAEGDWRGSWPQETNPDWLENQVHMATLVKEVVAGSGLQTPEFCLKYVLGSDAVSAVIPRSANPDHVRANLSVSAVPALNDALRRQVKDLWLRREIQGTYAGSA
jgi:aryl-alcohol dehydrogenase-like predicted oxidoreductase